MEKAMVLEVKAVARMAKDVELLVFAVPSEDHPYGECILLLSARAVPGERAFCRKSEKERWWWCVAMMASCWAWCLSGKRVNR